MVVPSTRACVVSVMPTAVYGAPATTFPGCISSNPRIFMRAPIGPPGISSSCGGGPGGGSCAPSTAALLNIAAVKTDRIHFLFIPISPLLLSCCFSSERGKRAARNSIARFRKSIGLRLPIGAKQQIHLHDVSRMIFIYRQSQRTKRTALHLDTYNRGVVPHSRNCAGDQCKLFAVICGNQGAAELGPSGDGVHGRWCRRCLPGLRGVHGSIPLPERQRCRD